MEKDFFAKWLPKFFEKIETRILKNKPSKYLVGDSITIADFAMLGLVYMLIKNETCPDSPKFLKEYNKHKVFKEYIEGIEPEIRDYLDQRPTGFDY
jgi:glutathione S-transferase